ncbi:MAG: ComEC/Rec2 family competence protein [Alistipes sp.]|nr:ComEC/Rec2 family competence protein [Alistipes sp.]
MMNLSRLSERLERMPMMKALVPFVLGILLAEHYALPGWFVVMTVLLAGGIAVLFRSAGAMVVLLLSIGFGQAQLQQRHRTVPQEVWTEFDLCIEGIPSDRGRYTTVEAVATAWHDPVSDEWFAADDRLMLYVDTLVEVQHGERIVCSGRVRDFRGGAESYRRLMCRRGFAGTFWVAERHVSERNPVFRRTFHARAVERLARLGLSGQADALARAMVAGDKSRLASDLRNRYAVSGFSHLLAVSGLHTGIVFGLVYLLFGWLVLFRRGHLYYYAVSAAAVWLFVAAAGFPPSAVRAALLCTLVQGALFAGKEHDALNSLAVAAFVMLLWRSAWLGDISFQLSFLAVAFLLAWGMPMQRRFRTRWRWLNAAIGAVVVSVVAGVATAPLVSHTFGMIPLVGILLNPIALLPATVIVLCGTVWMLVPFSFLAPFLRGGIEYSVWVLEAVTRCIERMPGACIEYRLDAPTTVGIYLLFAVATLAMWSVKPRERKSARLRR